MIGREGCLDLVGCLASCCPRLFASTRRAVTGLTSLDFECLLTTAPVYVNRDLRASVVPHVSPVAVVADFYEIFLFRIKYLHDT